jgi:hypothetical protein
VILVVKTLVIDQKAHFCPKFMEKYLARNLYLISQILRVETKTLFIQLIQRINKSLNLTLLIVLLVEIHLYSKIRMET